ncbi:unnamed protein product (macronuclear) [Paramecium tetraurelia]|uniref:Uncharacterized protein n=1 Tax=Paramecium tetraurelia TaxID=5888 RepID=A0EG67_PARTE|nr:uncharacterized protein GSPATT00026632001 [Paramecium tetraurelia]CAK94308.1 unnamed protein product [Paramecium tetraurelia]|eukprot:XP_001461681.1 hypothetical protein (macronuclear) [Paramecium tetraurelia strain d4-2]
MNIKQLFELQEQDADKLPLLLQTISHSKNEEHVRKAINIIQQFNQAFNANQQLSIIDFINEIKKEYDIAIDIKLISTLLHIIDINWMPNCTKVFYFKYTQKNSFSIYSQRTQSQKTLQSNNLLSREYSQSSHLYKEINYQSIWKFSSQSSKTKIKQKSTAAQTPSFARISSQFCQKMVEHSRIRNSTHPNYIIIYYPQTYRCNQINYQVSTANQLRNQLNFCDIKLHTHDGRPHLITRLNNQFIHKITIKGHFKNCYSRCFIVTISK